MKNAVYGKFRSTCFGIDNYVYL